MGKKQPVATKEEVAAAVASLRQLADLQAVTLGEMDALLEAAWNTQARLLAISVASAHHSAITGKGTRLTPFPEWKPDRDTARRLRLAPPRIKDIKGLALQIQAEISFSGKG